MGTILSFGEVLWDLMPNGDYLGGAPFNFAANCARLGHRVLFVSAVGDDPMGARTIEAIEASGISSRLVGCVPQASTGTVRVEFDENGQPQYTIIRPAAYDFLRLDEELVNSIVASRADILYFGTLSQLYQKNQTALFKLIDALPESLCFYDLNLRKDSFDTGLLMQLMQRAQVVKMNEEETKIVQELFGAKTANLKEFCRTYSRRFGWRECWVTLGAAGCVVLHDGKFIQVPGFPVATPNPVGAGDAFSAAVCHGMLRNWPVLRIAEFANKVGALIASRPGAVFAWSIEDIESMNSGRTSSTDVTTSG
jgi:fructokinase